MKNNDQSETTRLRRLGAAVLGGQRLEFVGDERCPLVFIKDICERIGVGKVQDVANRLEEGKMKVLIDTKFMRPRDSIAGSEIAKSGGRYRWAATKRGVYEILMTSRTERAERWRDAIFDFFEKVERGEITIKRADWSTATVEQIEEFQDALARLVNAKRNAALLERKVEENRTKAELIDALAKTGNTITVGELASILSKNGYRTGQNRLFSQLRAEGFLIRYGERRNQPTQTAIEMGVMESRESVVKLDDGETIVAFQPRITPKGQQYFLKRYAEDSDDEKQTA